MLRSYLEALADRNKLYDFGHPVPLQIQLNVLSGCDIDVEDFLR